MEPDAPKRRITFEIDYPQPDMVGLVVKGEGQFRDIERGYLVADEDGVVRFVPNDRKSQQEACNK